MTDDNDGEKRSASGSVAQSSRRRFLTGVVATGGLVAAGGIVYAQQGDPTTYNFNGVIAGWMGTAPDAIAGTTNPTLHLTAGTEYTVTWTNGDGAPHNFAILSSDGNVLHRTEIMSNQGATQSTTFTASEDMATYICQVHPNSMVGDIAFGETTGNQTTETETETPVDNSNVSDLPDESPPTGPLGESNQKFIAQLKAKEGVNTDATGTAYFTLYPPTYSVQANILFSLYIDGLDNITAAHIHLDRPDEDNPVVAPLYPTDDLVTSEVNRTYAMNATNGTGMTNATNMTNGVNVTNATSMTNTTNGTNSGVPGDTAATGDQDATGPHVPENPSENRTHEIPADALPGTTLADSQLVAEDLTGPFEDADSLLPLVEAMNNGESFVQVHTEDNPGGAILGPIMPAEGMAQNGSGGGNETTDGDGDNGKAKNGNGKAKSGNGKAKNGDGKQS